MARFDVYANSGRSAGTTPYLLDVQSGLLDGLDSRMVIPLRGVEHFPPVRLPHRLMPVLMVQGKEYILETPKMAAVLTRILHTPIVSLAHERDRIAAALDFLFQGF